MSSEKQNIPPGQSESLHVGAVSQVKSNSLRLVAHFFWAIVVVVLFTSSVSLDVNMIVGAVVAYEFDGISEDSVDSCESLQRIFLKQNVPSPHMESPSLHVCNVNEHDDSTSDRLVAQ